MTNKRRKIKEGSKGPGRRDVGQSSWSWSVHRGRESETVGLRGSWRTSPRPLFTMGVSRRRVGPSRGGDSRPLRVGSNNVNDRDTMDTGEKTKR